MAFAFKLFFSEESSRPVRMIWDELDREKLASFLKASGSTPGLTLGVFDEGDEAEIVKWAECFAESISPFSVTSWGIGNFPTSPAHVFLGVILSEELRGVHARFTERARAVGKISDYYETGRWLPHSTIAIRCDLKEIPEITRVALRHETRLEFRIHSAAVVEIGSARVVAEFPLPEGA